MRSSQCPCISAWRNRRRGPAAVPAPANITASPVGLFAIVGSTGGPQVVQEMVAGRVDFYVSPTLAIVPQYEAKQIKILAVSAPERLKNLPDIPTLTEKGIDFVRFGWLGICAGAGTPQPIIERLHRDIAAIVATPEYRAMIEKAGSIAVSSTPDELNTTITQTLDEVSSSIREFGLQQE